MEASSRVNLVSFRRTLSVTIIAHAAGQNSSDCCDIFLVSSPSAFALRINEREGQKRYFVAVVVVVIALLLFRCFLAC